MISGSLCRAEGASRLEFLDQFCLFGLNGNNDYMGSTIASLRPLLSVEF